MRKSSWTLSIVPRGDDQNVYFVVDDVGRHGPVFGKPTLSSASRPGRHRSGNGPFDLLKVQYQSPIRVVAFNTAQGWSQDVSAMIPQELRRCSDLRLSNVPQAFRISSSAMRKTIAGS